MGADGRTGGRADGSVKVAEPSYSAEPTARPPDRPTALVIQTAFLGDVVLTTPLLTALADKYGPVDVVDDAGRGGAARDPSGGSARSSGTTRRVATRGSVACGGSAPSFAARRLRAGVPAASLLAIGGARAAGPRPGAHGLRGQSRRDYLYHARPACSAPATKWSGCSPWRADGRGRRRRSRSGSTAEDEAAADRWLAERGVAPGFIALAPGSIWGTKRWPYYRELAAALDGPLVVVVGGNDDGALADEVVAAAPARAWSAAGALSLRVSAALIARARVLVTNDSAPLHLAHRGRHAGGGDLRTDGARAGLRSSRLARASRWGTPALACRPCSAHGPAGLSAGPSPLHARAPGRDRARRRRPWSRERRSAVRFVLGIDIGGTNLVVGAWPRTAARSTRCGTEPTHAEAGAERRGGPDGRRWPSAPSPRPGEEMPDAEIVGVGVGAPGPLDTKSGIVLLTPNLGWVNLPLRQIIRDRLGLPADARQRRQLRRARRVVGRRRARDAGTPSASRSAPASAAGSSSTGGSITAPPTSPARSATRPSTPKGRRCKCGNYGCLEAYASGPEHRAARHRGDRGRRGDPPAGLRAAATSRGSRRRPSTRPRTTATSSRSRS